MFDFLKQGQVTLNDVEKSIQELPLPDKIRALAIYKRYKQIRKVEDQMKKAVKKVEKEYLKLDEPILTNVSKLVQGKKPIEEHELKDLDKYLNPEEKEKVAEHMGARKMKDYWFKVLKNAAMISKQISTDDEELLKAIEDIHIVDEEGTDNFTIVFEMAENEFIKNEQLTKKFYLKNDEPTKSEGSPIEWKGKNLTMKEIKKKQKNKKTGQHRVVTKTVEAKSFFNFFKSVEAPEVNAIEGNEEDLEKREKLESDFELGGILVDEVLPYSLEYYLGIEHDDDLDDEDEDMEESDEEEDEKPKKKSKSKGKKQKNTEKGAEQKPQCKQQ